MPVHCPHSTMRHTCMVCSRVGTMCVPYRLVSKEDTMLEIVMLIGIALFFGYVFACTLYAQPNRMRDWVSRK